MNKVREMITSSLQVAASLSTAKSSINLLDMQHYQKAVVTCVCNKPMDDTTVNFPMTATIYQSTAATWNGAVAVALPAYSGTAACSSATSGWKQFEIDVKDLTINSDYRYLGAYVQAWTKTDMTVIVERYRGNYEPLS
jgi:hypothetical protein